MSRIPEEIILITMEFSALDFFANTVDWFFVVALAVKVHVLPAVKPSVLGLTFTTAPESLVRSYETGKLILEHANMSKNKTITPYLNSLVFPFCMSMSHHNNLKWL